MENVRIAVLDIGNHAVAFMDNRVPKALHFYNDELHTYLKGAAQELQVLRDLRE